MPNTTLIQEFDAIVSSVAEDDVRRYLEEARKCFAAGANNATVVMAWCGVVLYFRRVVERISFDFLAYQLWALDISQERKEKPEYAFNNWKRPIIENKWQKVGDLQLLKACARVGIRVADQVRGSEFRIRRNALAHPGMEFVTPEEALDLVKSGQDVYSHSVRDERFGDIVNLFTYAKQTTDDQAVEQAARYLSAPDDDILEYAHKVLNAFTGSEDASVEGVTGLWKALWSRLDDGRKKSLWKQIERKLQAILDDPEAPRRPEDLARFVVWPDPFAEHKARDRIAEMYITWLEDRVSNDEIIDDDMVLARGLRQHLSGPLRERLQRVLEEMIK